MKKRDEVEKNLFGVWFWIHLPLVILANSSFLIFDWGLILIGVLALQLQFLIFKGCVLTIAEFGKTKDITFYTVYLEKIGFKFNRRKFMLYMRYFHPIVILILAITFQVFFKLKVPISL